MSTQKQDWKYPNVDIVGKYEVLNNSNDTVQFMLFDETGGSSYSYTLAPKTSVNLRGIQMTELIYRLEKSGKVRITKK